MSKLSSFPPNASPALTDELVSIQAPNSTPVDVLITIQTLVNLINKTTLLSNPYKFSAYASSTTSIPGSFTSTKVGFQTAFFDTGSNYNTSTSRFVAPVAGFYYFNANVAYTLSGAQEADFSFYKNGSVIRSLNTMVTAGGGTYAHCGTMMIQLAANDYIEVYGTAGSACTVASGQANSVFEGYLFSAT